MKYPRFAGCKAIIANDANSTCGIVTIMTQTPSEDMDEKMADASTDSGALAKESPDDAIMDDGGSVQNSAVEVKNGQAISDQLIMFRAHTGYKNDIPPEALQNPFMQEVIRAANRKELAKLQLLVKNSQVRLQEALPDIKQTWKRLNEGDMPTAVERGLLAMTQDAEQRKVLDLLIKIENSANIDTVAAPSTGSRKRKLTPEVKKTAPDGLDDYLVENSAPKRRRIDEKLGRRETWGGLPVPSRDALAFAEKLKRIQEEY